MMFLSSLFENNFLGFPSHPSPSFLTPPEWNCWSLAPANWRASEGDPSPLPVLLLPWTWVDVGLTWVDLALILGLHRVDRLYLPAGEQGHLSPCQGPAWLSVASLQRLLRLLFLSFCRGLICLSPGYWVSSGKLWRQSQSQEKLANRKD